MTVLKRAPTVRTTRRDGFQLAPIDKKSMMLIFLTMPDTIRPMAKMKPIRKERKWSRMICFVSQKLLYCFDLRNPPTKGNITPKAMQTSAVARWL